MSSVKKYYISHDLIGEMSVSKEKYLHILNHAQKTHITTSFAQESFTCSDKKGWSGYIKRNTPEGQLPTIKINPDKVSLRDKMTARGIL